MQYDQISINSAFILEYVLTIKKSTNTVESFKQVHPWCNLLGSKTLGSKCIRTSMCDVGKPWSKHLV